MIGRFWLMPVIPEELRQETLEKYQREILAHYHADRWYAHQKLFPHRHPMTSPAAHKAIVDLINRPEPHRGIEGFRGLAKSTLLEETAIIKGMLREFHNMVIVAASYRMACDRLTPIANEFLNNEKIHAVLGGSLKGETWREDRIVLSNGVCIQALGRDAAMTGMKYGDWRPDAALIDDVEDPEEVRTDAERVETWRWFTTVFLPALDNPLSSWVRVLGTRRGMGSLPERLEGIGWPFAKFPVEYPDKDGNRKATWPAKFSIEDIDKLKETYRGDMHTYEQEFMCRAVSDTARLFKRDQFRYSLREPSWHAVYVFYDPARTKTQTSATTGKAVWSWVGNKLVVWECGGHFWSPDELIADIVGTAKALGPVWIGVEKTGLNDWLMQPLRHEAMKAGVLLPLIGVEAPRGKLDFIGALQPLFAAGEIEFAGPPEQFKVLEEQLLSFPRGRIDAPNALAYARTLRPGQPVYDGFSEDHIGLDPGAWHDTPVFLAAHSDGSVATGCLVQRRRGRLVVLADWVREGTPRELVGELAADAALAHGGTTLGEGVVYGEGSDLFKLPIYRPQLAATEIKWVVPPQHFNEWNNVGLVQAIRAIPQPVSMGGAPQAGRDVLAQSLGRHVDGGPALVVADRARWTLRGFAGGYARAVGGRGLQQVEAEAGIYKVLMEGLESFAGSGMVLRGEVAGADGDTPPSSRFPSAQPIAHTRSGMAYRSAIPERASRR